MESDTVVFPAFVVRCVLQAGHAGTHEFLLPTIITGRTDAEPDEASGREHRAT